MICGLFDLNTVNEDDEDVSLTVSSSSSASELLPPAPAPVECCLELWRACAGPSICLPRKGNGVVYCTQGHLEQHQQLHSAAGDECLAAGEVAVPPPHVFCRVIDVKLHAEVGTDDVYAQVSLIQDPQLERKWREGGVGVEYNEDDNGVVEKTTTPHMFCKTLTASDTSTHGGFSVPRRAAEDCFPPLDYKQQRPSQELVAKDLHGTDWRFRHIYRGQPRRHLLTTGWSAFINKKKLVCGDAVLFLRGDDGVLRLGIRRATQVRVATSLPPFLGQKSNDFDFSNVVKSISRRSAFSVCYNPRGGSSEFIVPVNRFLKTLAVSFPPGMSFTTRIEAEDTGDRRSTGIIMGCSDIDPARWPGSKWRCLMVQWDCEEITRQSRVSPWEIERFGSVSDTGNFMSPLMKRTRTDFSVLKGEYFALFWRSTGASDFAESMQFHKVLQGQEIYGFYRSSEVSPQGNDIRNQTSVSFGESLRFNRVLQGQEISSNPQYGERAWTHTHPSSSSSPSSVLRFQQAISQAPSTYPLPLGGHNFQDFFGPLKSQLEEPVLTSPNSCRLFGFSLTEGSNGPNGEDRMHPIGPVVNTKVGGSCTNVSHLYGTWKGQFINGVDLVMVFYKDCDDGSPLVRIYMETFGVIGEMFVAEVG
ncbi:hypothetical protein SSX86_015650 [Deinandra increscens subsp. villosa]|uniref:Auxin response factor n=1 Tax=Deinandra increscens subsp. villosa TaxID=3103831 RepID=A0AAP0CWG4_9ASTR